MNTTNTTEETEPTDPKPWNDKLAKARQGDRDALNWCCLEAEPVIARLCHVPYFNARFGKDEIRSTASLALLEYVMGDSPIPPDAEVPRLLKRIMRCEILDSIRRKERRSQFEQPETILAGSGEDEEAPLLERQAADSGDGPDARILRQELAREIETAMQQLTETERQVIRALFFHRKTTEEAAKELGCSGRYIRKVRSCALARLRRLLESRAIQNG